MKIFRIQLFEIILRSFWVLKKNKYFQLNPRSYRARYSEELKRVSRRKRMLNSSVYKPFVFSPCFAAVYREPLRPFLLQSIYPRFTLWAASRFYFISPSFSGRSRPGPVKTLTVWFIGGRVYETFSNPLHSRVFVPWLYITVYSPTARFSSRL